MSIGKLIVVVVAVAVVGLMGCAEAQEPSLGTDEQAAGRSCDFVRCFAAPQCAEGQHVIYTPNDCCGRCVGPSEWSPRCGGVLCAAVACDAGEQRVYHPGTCCGVCVPTPHESTCGDNVCGSNEYCCNESCGQCAPIDGYCTQQVCRSGGTL